MSTGYYGNTRNNNNAGVSVNTNFMSSYSETAIVKIGGWNKTVNIAFSPRVGTDAEGKRTYATENNQQIRTSLTIENAITLKDALDKKEGTDQISIFEAIDQKKAKTASVFIGDASNKKLLTLGFDGANTFIELATNLDEKNVATDANKIRSNFNKKQYLTNYNSTTGTGTPSESEAEFKELYTILSNIIAMIPVAQHTTKYESANKAAYSKAGNNTQTGAASNAFYQAPTSNFGNADMSDMLPFS